jgi:sorbose reductase
MRAMSVTTNDTNRDADVTGRADLAKRAIPYMVLSNGSSSSLTPPPAQSINVSPSEGAKQRFEVTGNAIVTGGAGALGYDACNALLEHGLEGLMIFDLNPDQCQQQLLLLRSRFPSAQIHMLQVDVADEAAVAAAVKETTSLLGSVNHLFSFAGVVGCVHAISMNISQWRKILDINLTGAFICAQAAAKVMADQGTGGSITFIASISAHRVNFPQPQAAYNVSKSALLMLKSCLAAEWMRYGIRTNSISPGYMDTVLNEGDGLADVRQRWNLANPSGRMGVPSELTGVVVMLASQASSYINGADIVVDGGGIVF